MSTDPTQAGCACPYYEDAKAGSYPPTGLTSSNASASLRFYAERFASGKTTRWDLAAHLLEEAARILDAPPSPSLAEITARELLEALEPLAAIGGGTSAVEAAAGLHFAAYYDCPSDLVIYKHCGKAITVGDVRRARRLLARERSR